MNIITIKVKIFVLFELPEYIFCAYIFQTLNGFTLFCKISLFGKCFHFFLHLVFFGVFINSFLTISLFFRVFKLINFIFQFKITFWSTLNLLWLWSLFRILLKFLLIISHDIFQFSLKKLLNHFLFLFQIVILKSFFISTQLHFWYLKELFGRYLFWMVNLKLL